MSIFVPSTVCRVSILSFFWFGIWACATHLFFLRFFRFVFGVYHATRACVDDVSLCYTSIFVVG